MWFDQLYRPNAGDARIGATERTCHHASRLVPALRTRDLLLQSQ